MIEIFKGYWNISDIKNNQNKIFVFGDNDMRYGKKGQSIIRDFKNTIGLRTKKEPTLNIKAFYNDIEYESNIQKIDEDILKIKELEVKGNIIVLSDGGYGTGLSNLERYAPKTFNYLNSSLLYNFNFNNINGKKYIKIPGYDEIINAKEINIEDDSSILNVSNKLYLDNVLIDGLYSTRSIIESGRKVSFCQDKKYNSGELIKIKYNNSKSSICRVIKSYNIEHVKNWKIYECINDSCEIDPKIYKYQTHFQFICSLDKNKMTYRNDIFSNDQII